jgi:hypothetical protein
VFITGASPCEKTDAFAEMQYISKTKSFHAYLLIKAQGNSSLGYPKKNFTIKMYSDTTRETKLKMAFKDWQYETHKYVLKANYVDHTHARNIISANLWSQAIDSRSDYESLPIEMRNSPRNGAVDGFPVKVYVNGRYEGLYTWNIGKDDWMFGMNEDNPNHIVLSAGHNTNGVYNENPCNFRALWSGTGYWEVEVGTYSDAVKNSFNALISCVKDTDDATFKSTISNYLDVQSAIDYWIHQYVICGLDNLAKNMLMATYDGVKWYCAAYDMDSTFGLWHDGTKFVSAEYRCPEDYQETYSLLFERIANVFNEEVKSRYAELRNSVYSYSNMIERFERFTDKIGKDLYAEDLEAYSVIPLGDINNIKQIRNFINNRLEYVDREFEGALYALEYGSYTNYGSSMTISDTNTITIIGNNLTEDKMFQANISNVTRATESNSAQWGQPEMFTISEGDVIRCVMDGETYLCADINFATSVPNDYTRFYTNFPSATYDQSKYRDYTFVSDKDFSVGAICIEARPFYAVPNQTIKFRLKLYINGVRYI